MPWHTSYSEMEGYHDEDSKVDPPITHMTHHQYRHPGQAAIAHELYVAHNPTDGMYRVRIGHPGVGGTNHAVSLDAGRLSSQVRATGMVGRSVTAAPPSDALRHLIAGHHEHGDWTQLVDALAEEYPEHFWDAVNAHTAARALP